eukprot:3137220-Prymnesium_polylepis.1
MWVGLRLARLVLVARRAPRRSPHTATAHRARIGRRRVDRAARACAGLHSRRRQAAQRLDVTFGYEEEDEEAGGADSGDIELSP